jgi:hypothetical protein
MLVFRKVMDRLADLLRHDRRITYRAFINARLAPHVTPLLDRIVADNEDGEALRIALIPWQRAERPPITIYRGDISTCRIDGPWQVTGDHCFPLGGLILSTSPTILNLLREIKADEVADASPAPDAEKRLADIMDMVSSDAQLRSKRDLIEKFIQQNMPLIKPDEYFGEAFKAYWDEEKEATLSAICVEEGLDRSRFDKLVDHFNFSGQNPLRDDIVAALNVQPKILERRKIVNRILERLIGFIRTFEDDFGEL